MNRKGCYFLLFVAPFLIILTLGCIGCVGNTETGNPSYISGGGSTETGNPTNISGLIQKGPYYKGATVVIKELDNIDFSPTGIEHVTKTVSDLGEFMESIDISSSYVEISATGYYYNETTGISSTSPVTLSAFADIAKTREVNINILTSIAIKREKYLITNEGKTYEDAKIQARREVLNIFEIPEEVIEELEKDGEDIDTFIHMNIGSGGDKNAILLALSIILQGDQPTYYVSEVIQTIRNDIEVDGVFDDPEYIEELLFNATGIDLEQIRINLENHYDSLSEQAEIPAFEDYIRVSAPIFSLPSETYNHDITVELATETPGAYIYYTINNGDLILYEDPIEISGDQTIADIRAVSVKSKLQYSYTVSSYYFINYDFDPKKYKTDMTFAEYQANIVGTWVGTAESPWVYPYNVRITFFDTMQYSAKAISHYYNYSGIYNTYGEYWGTAFYYGIDEDSEKKTIDIYDIYANGKAVSNIVILYEYGNTNMDKLDQIAMSEDYNHLQFQYWHRGQYGPIIYNLTRLVE